MIGLIVIRKLFLVELRFKFLAGDTLDDQRLRIELAMQAVVVFIEVLKLEVFLHALESVASLLGHLRPTTLEVRAQRTTRRAAHIRLVIRGGGHILPTGFGLGASSKHAAADTGFKGGEGWVWGVGTPPSQPPN